MRFTSLCLQGMRSNKAQSGVPGTESAVQATCVCKPAVTPVSQPNDTVVSEAALLQQDR